MIWLELDPDVVKPGWTPLIITVLLLIAVVLLVANMRKQLGKINIPRADDEPEPPEANGPAPKSPPPA